MVFIFILRGAGGVYSYSNGAGGTLMLMVAGSIYSYVGVILWM